MITDHPYNDGELALPFNVLYYILYSGHVTALPFLTFKHVLLHEDMFNGRQIIIILVLFDHR